jgi:hypothetical protein
MLLVAVLLLLIVLWVVLRYQSGGRVLSSPLLSPRLAHLIEARIASD